MGEREQDCIITTRGATVENKHTVHAAVTDATGKLLYAVGNPSRVTLARSAAKPAQALAILETGCFEQFGLDDADLALICSSHSSEDRHISRTREMLAKVHVREEDLRCGGHPALSGAVNRAWIKSDYEPTGVCNNCSGKHVGMLAGSKAIGAEIRTYHHSDHPMQLRVKRVTEELCLLDGASWGIDGCNLPAPAFPLHYMGKMYTLFAAAVDTTEQDDNPSARTKAMSRIFHSMTQYPELVAGDERFCTVLMQTFQGALIGKLGADGCYGVGIRACEQTRRLGVDGAIGFAVKIEDGNVDTLYSAVVGILEQLGIETAETRQELGGFHCPDILNSVGVVTGRTLPLFTVRNA